MSEYDLELVREILRQMLWSAQTIAKRFEPIAAPGDFVASEEGLEKLDAISMQLIAIGENLKNLEGDRGFATTSIPANRVEARDGYARYPQPSLF